MMHQSVARIHSPGHTLARLAGLLALALLGPACYSKSGHTYMAPAAPGGAGVLVSDVFFPYPNGNWVGATGSNATASEFFDGVSHYYLRMQDTTRPGHVSDMTKTSLASEALTFKIDFRSSTTTTVADQAFIQIIDGSDHTTVLAQAVYDASTGKITFSIGATMFTAVTYAAGAFQTISFTIDSGFGGTWAIGGTSEGSAAFGAHTTQLGLGASWSATAGTAPIFDFGNLVISNP